MKRLWAPWRMDFVENVHKYRGTCIFCDLPKKGLNAKTLVLYKGKTAYVILNRYPYSNGHLMVVPFRHLSRFETLKVEEHMEIGLLVSASIQALKKECKAQGFNVGLNLGKAAGAGIKGHLHYHIVPRWIGDHNLMAVLSDIRTMPEHLERTYNRLKPYFLSPHLG